MSAISDTFTLPEGRIVTGHPMKRNVRKDDNGQPKLNKTTGEQIMETYFGLAIPKAGETFWHETEWGKRIHAVATGSWPQGQWKMAGFAWKIEDGDSSIPNKKMKIPNQRDGWKGHWVIHFTTSFSVQCFHPQQNGIFPQMQSDSEIKCGDYVYVNAMFKGNDSTQTAGIYANPSMVLLSRIGEAIVGGDANPDEAFAGLPTSAPSVAAPVTTAFAPPPPAPTEVTPNYDFLAPPPPEPAEEPKLKNGFTESQLRANGWSDAQIATVR